MTMDEGRAWSGVNMFSEVRKTYDVRVSNNRSDNICAWSEGGPGLKRG